jgi:hypothetical protein
MLDGFIVFKNNLAGFKNHQRVNSIECARESGRKFTRLFISSLADSLIRFIQKNLSVCLIKRFPFSLALLFLMLLLCRFWIASPMRFERIGTKKEFLASLFSFGEF